MYRKLVLFVLISLALATTALIAATGPSTNRAPYLVGSLQDWTGIPSDVQFVSILTVGDSVRKRGTTSDPYRMVGIPDGLGAYDNQDGTITVLMNHELTPTTGIVRAHGGAGAFVSRWQIRKSDLKVLNGQDLIEKVMLWDSTNGTYVLNTKTAFSRFCSADLPAVTAFFNVATGKGLSEARLFLNGEEDAATGRAMANVVTGKDTGTSYELFKFGKHAWENLLANPFPQDLTVVAANEDGGLNKVYFYTGQKQETGTPADMAGLNNGTLYELLINGYTNDDPTTGFKEGTFSLVTSGGTSLARPEDGVWDPANPNRYYFVTTASFTGNSRLWQVTFKDITNPQLGGTVKVLLDGGASVKMMDNITIDDDGRIYIQEDIGNNARLGLIWSFGADGLKFLGAHDPRLFDTNAPIGNPSFLTEDEESSGIIDVTRLFTGVTGYDTAAFKYLLLDVQAHYTIPGELVEGGQLLMMRVPKTPTK